MVVLVLSAAALGAAPPSPKPSPAIGGLTGRVSGSTVGAARPATRTALDLKVTEYACYGSGGRVLIGLGFKVKPGHRFTDLDGGNAGSYSVSGTKITFRGGHLDGQVGQDLEAKPRGATFRIGSMAQCEPWQ